MDAKTASRRLSELASPERAIGSARFFKTGDGQYGEGDQFIGVSVPDNRKLAREFRELPLSEVEQLLASAIHEERLLALLILVGKLTRCTPATRKEIFEFYLTHTDRVNNWDLVDTSAPAIVGGYLVDKKDRQVLNKLVRSANLWERRIAIIATQTFIRDNQFEWTLLLAERLLKDKHDLIHKAVGWMLREVGDRHQSVLSGFLDSHAASMPRTMLRYAIEHYSAEERKQWLSKSKN